MAAVKMNTIAEDVFFLRSGISYCPLGKMRLHVRDRRLKIAVISIIGFLHFVWRGGSELEQDLG
jgi:hypothetical protein